MLHSKTTLQGNRTIGAMLAAAASIIALSTAAYGTEVHNVERAGGGLPIAAIYLDRVSAVHLVAVLRPVAPWCGYLAGAPQQNTIIISAPKEKLSQLVDAVLEIDRQPGARSPKLDTLRRDAPYEGCSDSDWQGTLELDSETILIERADLPTGQYAVLLKPLLSKTGSMSVAKGRLSATDSPARVRAIGALIEILDIERNVDRGALISYPH